MKGKPIKDSPFEIEIKKRDYSQDMTPSIRFSSKHDFLNPIGTAVNSLGQIIVSVWENSIQVFNEDGTFLFKFGSKGAGNGQFLNPNAVCVDQNDDIIVVDRGNNRLQKFNKEGVFISKFGILGTGPGEFSSPSCVAIGKNDQLYVGDLVNNRVQVFSFKQGFIRQFGKGKLNGPSGIAVNSIDDVIVCEWYANRIQIFDSLGNLKFKSEVLLSTPQHVTVNENDDIFVADRGNNRISVFNPQAMPLFNFGTGQLSQPSGISIDKRNGKIIICELLAHQITIYE